MNINHLILCVCHFLSRSFSLCKVQRSDSVVLPNISASTFTFPGQVVPSIFTLSVTEGYYLGCSTLSRMKWTKQASSPVILALVSQDTYVITFWKLLKNVGMDSVCERRERIRFFTRGQKKKEIKKKKVVSNIERAFFEGWNFRAEGRDHPMKVVG